MLSRAALKKASAAYAFAMGATTASSGSSAGATPNGVERDAVGSLGSEFARSHNDEVRRGAVDHVGLRAIEYALGGCFHRDVIGRPAFVRLCERQRCDRLAGRDARQQRLLLL